MSHAEVKPVSFALNSSFEAYLLSFQRFKLRLENFRLIVNFYALFGGGNSKTVNESLSDSLIMAR